GPATDTRKDGDILVPVRAAIRDRLADDAGAGLELPFELAAMRVHRLEPAVHGSVENEIACRNQGAAPDGQILLDLPGRLALHRIPRGQLAAVAARPGFHHHVRPDIRRAGD